MDPLRSITPDLNGTHTWRGHFQVYLRALTWANRKWLGERADEVDGDVLANISKDAAEEWTVWGHRLPHLGAKYRYSGDIPRQERSQNGKASVATTMHR